MADLAKIVDTLSSLTVLEAAELSKLLEEKWGVSAAAPVAVAAAGGGAAAAAPVEEKTEFDVILSAAGAQKINVITTYSWLLYPAFAVIIIVLAFNFLGDGLRDAADGAPPAAGRVPAR